MKNNLSLVQWLIILAAFFALLSCCNQTVDSTKRLSDWTTKAKKPITCRMNNVNAFTYQRNYTLVDGNGSVYVTGPMDLNLPDTIK
jgi:hypothetical protein